jgi:hypothetical protein
MNSFIFGFQRLTWWPKWTPASSNSFIVTVTAKLLLLQVIGFVYSPRPKRPEGATNRAAAMECAKRVNREP